MCRDETDKNKFCILKAGHLFLHGNTDEADFDAVRFLQNQHLVLLCRGCIRKDMIQFFDSRTIQYSLFDLSYEEKKENMTKGSRREKIGRRIR